MKRKLEDIGFKAQIVNARTDGTLLEALPFTAQPEIVSRNNDLTRNILTDIERSLPDVRPEYILSHDSSILNTTFSPNGKCLVTASLDSTVLPFTVCKC